MGALLFRIRSRAGRLRLLGGRITPAEIAAIRVGDEGQFRRMMDLAAFLIHPLAIDSLAARLGDAL